jgi:tetratricopeptide (TPR) repeat protein
LNRREFLISTAAVANLGAELPAEESRPQEPPYLALEKSILPGSDDFPLEKTAAEIVRALHSALRANRLPFPPLGTVRRAQFFPLPGGVIRYEVASEKDGKLFYRVGRWKQNWESGRIGRLEPLDEHVASADRPFFRDVTAAVLERTASFREQLARGIPYWRSRLDPATGIDIYGSNGVAVGDIDGDGADEVYVCQPGGLPNRLFKFREDGTLADITEVWGVGILDDTSSALFLDLRNSGRQDLVVLRSNGPVLFLNDGKRFAVRTDAFQFASAPQGGFTGMAAADFDRDGKLDLYLCCYVYFQSEAQYTYATPYQDAQNGPPNFLFRNRLNPDGSGFLEDCTAETGMNANNNRFSFAPAWCDYNGDGWPDLYVANDFGRKNLYVNREGRFRDVAAAAGVEDIGPGMSAAWFDYDHDGKADLYVANMWTAAGQRVVHDPHFGKAEAKNAYQRHTMGNSLFRNRGDGTFEDATSQQQVEFGRWAWSADGVDIDNDGETEIFITCGMLTNESTTDLNGFFWRQVVARSPATQQPSPAYQNGWNAINQFIREDYSWNGREPNVLHVKRGDRYFDYSGVSGLDFADDSRAFAVTDFDDDGRPDIVLKSRLGPQVRVLQNDCAGANRSIAFELRGTKSNRDAIGARVEVDGQTKWLSAGSGFLSQHSKRVLFGLGSVDMAKRVHVIWPSGAVQELSELKAGHVYSVVEGTEHIEARPFRTPRRPPALPVEADNSLRLEDTWFFEPIPLPEPKSGPGLFVLDTANPRYEIFRRYLFDWRTPLVTPLALLLNESGHAIKIYASVPSAQQVKADLAHRGNGLRFPGDYLNLPHRDFFKLGGAFLWSGYAKEALPYLEKVLDRTPNNARVLLLVGQIADDLGQQARAEAMYRRALSADPQSPEAANGLGLALAKLGRGEEARTYFQQAIRLQRDFSGAINNLGALYIQQGKINDAIAAFEYGIRVAPDDDILYLNLGRTYTQQGNIERARQVMQQLLDRKPDNATARHALQELSGR